METSNMPELIAEQRLVGLLPSAEFGEMIAPVEVMVQEQLGCLAIPADSLENLDQLRAIFGTRAIFGVHGVRGSQITQVLNAKPAFVALQFPDEAAINTCRDASVLVMAPALTPNEVSAVWDLGVDVVMVMPAESLGSSYASWLRKMVPEAALMPMGGLSSYAATKWLQEGAALIGLDQSFFTDGFEGNLGRLRAEASSMVNVTKK